MITPTTIPVQAQTHATGVYAFKVKNARLLKPSNRTVTGHLTENALDVKHGNLVPFVHSTSGLYSRRWPPFGVRIIRG
jgi:hypothetical protein